MGPADARMASVAAAAGFPVGTVPLGYADFNGRAFGINLLAASGQESKIIEVMSAWEETFAQARKPPPMLVNWDLKGKEANNRHMSIFNTFMFFFKLYEISIFVVI